MAPSFFKFFRKPVVIVSDRILGWVKLKKTKCYLTLVNPKLKIFCSAVRLGLSLNRESQCSIP